MYGLLMDKDKIDSACCKRWEHDIGITIQENDWLCTHKYVLDISANTAIREAYVNLYNCWYLMPGRLYNMFPGTDSRCWRCHKSLGSWIHIWWACPILRKFWTEVHYEITVNIEIPVRFTPEDHYIYLLDWGKRNLHCWIIFLWLPKYWSQSIGNHSSALQNMNGKFSANIDYWCANSSQLEALRVEVYALCSSFSQSGLCI